MGSDFRLAVMSIFGSTLAELQARELCLIRDGSTVLPRAAKCPQVTEWATARRPATLNSHPSLRPSVRPSVRPPAHPSVGRYVAASRSGAGSSVSAPLLVAA